MTRPAHRIPREVIDFFEADDRRGEWSIREHSRLKRQWRWVRRLPIILQVLLALGVLAYVDIVATISWLVVGGLTMR
jgi:hypothetical protein